MSKMTAMLEDALKLYTEEREESIMSNIPFKPSDRLWELMYEWAESAGYGQHNKPQ